MLIPASGTEPAIRVPIDFDAKPSPLSGGIHGIEQGPAQYKLICDGRGWRAEIEINETVHQRDVPFTIGHELDEIALIVRLKPDEAAILAEGKANLFKPSSSSTKATAHDRAAARDHVQSGRIYNSHNQEQQPVGSPSDKNVRSDKLSFRGE